METIQIFSDVVTYKEGLIPIAPLCRFFDLDVQNQQKKIKNDPVLGKSQGKNSKYFGQIEKNRPILLNQKGFIRWVQIINPKTIRADLRNQFTKFQADIFDFFYGKMEEEAIMRKKYRQLNKMKKGRNLLDKRIRAINKDFQNYLHNKYGQKSIDFKQKRISE